MADAFEFLSNATPAYIDGVYQQYRQNPDSVSEEWRRFFEGYEFAVQYSNGNGAPAAAPSRTQPTAAAVDTSGVSDKEFNVLNLITGYRTRGHLFTTTNPVRERRKYSPTLDLENFGLSEADLDTVFEAGREIGLGAAPLRDILDFLQQTYRRSIGAEFMYVSKPPMVKWLQEKMERSRNTPDYSKEKRLHILRRLNEAVSFEQFLGRKYVGQKRFSLEGGESIIPALDAAIERGAELGIREFVMGMAHRGRLNVLANTLRKEHDDIFGEFEGIEHADSVFQGDVKYHLGFSSDVKTDSGNDVHLSLMPNPSHLEAVDPVVQGSARAKIDRKYEGNFQALCPILIHGDAAIAAQGIVYEVIQMSTLDGYKTGGTLHIVINNQVGFTTNYIDGRSSTYCTDVAKVTQSPVFHVNGDDVEAVVYAVELAMEFRQKYNRDVFIDLLCYRRHGHNEADEPMFTQPILYKIIKKHPDPYKIYRDKLIENGLISSDEAKNTETAVRNELQENFEEARSKSQLERAPYLKGTWEGIQRAEADDFLQDSPATGVEREVLEHIVKELHQIPKDFKEYKKIERLFQSRMQMVEDDKLDWALGELLAYGTLLRDGHSVRLSGQDVRRGTFSHRHSVLTSTNAEEEYIPLNHLYKDQANFIAYNSLLSEYGVLGFEYGYSLSSPNHLVIWEAQFGDFANGAQIIMDQYISSAETKWQRMSGLVQYLPHGFEGQGPEHSSARIERYLELCANKNMQILNVTLPANFFHALRRQFSRPFRIPAVFFTPKKLLRYPAAVSPLEDFTTHHRFQEVIDDPKVDPKKVKRVVMCSGKVYYDLLEKQEADERLDVALVRMEQLYPLPITQLRRIISRYPKNTEWVWVQEEPRNMGPWGYISRVITDVEKRVICRHPSPSPATGYYKQHVKEQTQLVEAAFELSNAKEGAIVV